MIDFYFWLHNSVVQMAPLRTSVAEKRALLWLECLSLEHKNIFSH